LRPDWCIAQCGDGHRTLVEDTMSDNETMMVSAAHSIKENALEMIRLLHELQNSKISQVKPEIVNLIIDLDSFIERIDQIF
jgi:predicted RecB family endonuclease